MVLPTASAQGQQYNRPIVALLRNWTLLEARLEDFIGRDSGRAGGGMVRACQAAKPRVDLFKDDF